MATKTEAYKQTRLEGLCQNQAIQKPYEIDGGLKLYLGDDCALLSLSSLPLPALASDNDSGLVSGADRTPSDLRPT